MRKRDRKISNPFSVGEYYPTNNCWDIEVLEYVTKTACKVKFISTGTTLTVKTSNLRKGTIRDPYHPWIHGIGYIGVGQHLTYSGRTESGGYCSTSAYSTWRGMLDRCYGAESLKKTNKCYSDVTVCKEWHNFQNFADWYTVQKPATTEKLLLDKDLKIPGNKVYCPDSCTFVPARINSLFTGWISDRDLPRGVVRQQNGKFQAKMGDKCSSNSKKRTISLGTYSTEEEAFEAYVLHKNKLVKEVADSYRGLLDPIVYGNLISGVFTKERTRND